MTMTILLVTICNISFDDVIANSVGSHLKVVNHKCVKGSNIISCSGNIVNQGLARTSIIQLIVFFKNTEGKIVNMIESTSKPSILGAGQQENYDVSVSLGRLSSDWSTTGSFAFSKE
jgi:hypothetical protein